jgi:hypothetical protein
MMMERYRDETIPHWCSCIIIRSHNTARRTIDKEFHRFVHILYFTLPPKQHHHDNDDEQRYEYVTQHRL